MDNLIADFFKIKCESIVNFFIQEKIKLLPKHHVTLKIEFRCDINNTFFNSFYMPVLLCDFLAFFSKAFVFGLSGGRSLLFASIIQFKN
ncbi:hypothetical protein BpHYR1_031180 [Brachionus plicatilis]|uniref:Uncharacterized protein n=1 Tax=Brachionus plicatilis TaxID=10195 RepID=A0A3M7PGW6_BRAPC|nr:hypothetical protein BpHYR1_031180 [Brachionus plicatilis]